MKNIDKSIQEKIVDLITVLIPDAKIFLFVSRARQTTAQYKVDVLDLQSVSADMKESIKRDGKIWKS